MLSSSRKILDNLNAHILLYQNKHNSISVVQICVYKENSITVKVEIISVHAK